MGGSQSRLVNEFLEAILCGRDGKVSKMLKKYPKLAQCEFYNGTTNPMCRATYLGYRNIVALLLKYSADVNVRSSDQRTPLHWATFRDNTAMMQFLIDNGADMSLKDKDGWTPLDLAIVRINYKAALFLHNNGQQLRDISEYEGKTWRKYDLDMMFENIKNNIPEVPYKQFFEKIRKEREEWL